MAVVAVLVYECADAAVGDACDRHAGLDGAVADQVEVVPWGRTPAEPTIVSDVYHEPRAFAGGFAHEVSEYGVVADIRSPVVKVVDGSLCAGDEIPFAKVDIVQDGEDVVEGNPFAEGYQVLFDVALPPVVATWREHERRIVDFVPARAV